MTKNAIYIGTDASERWLRDELKTWSAEYFARESAWSFTPKERHIYFSKEGSTAWWEELLDTGMGLCRGSGVAALKNGVWKIVHYHLSLTLPNDKLDSFLELIKG